VSGVKPISAEAPIPPPTLIVLRDEVAPSRVMRPSLVDLAGAAVPSTDHDGVATGCGPAAFQLRQFNFDAGDVLGGGRRERQFDVLMNGQGSNGRSRLAQDGSGRRGRRVDAGVPWLLWMVTGLVPNAVMAPSTWSGRLFS
jgi:hypothetical protein